MKYFILIFTLVSALLLSQEVKFSKDFKINSTDISNKLYESSEVNVYYKFTSIDKESIESKTYETICILQIGRNYSKFIDTERLKLDSLYQKFSQEGHVGAKELNLLLRYKPLWSGIVLKRIKNDSIIRQNFVSNKICQYEEVPPHLDWQLNNETKEILGYQCRKATVTYRGRFYTAWYSPKLPLNDGPYIFRGLPGLVLEVEDKDEYIHFKAEAIDKRTMDIFLTDSRSIIRTSRDKCRELQKNYFYNPGMFTQGRAYNEDGTLLIPRSSTTKEFNPIELE